MTLFVLLCFFSSSALPQDIKKSMPREDVIDVPAIGDGLCVSNVFQSNMVIQREKPVVIWGWAEPGDSITVKFGSKESTVTAHDDRTWRASLPAMKANSSPQVMTIRGKSKFLALENILIGDVWVLGGQSNMEFPLDRIENGQLEIASANYDKIRILTVPAANGPKNKLGFPRLHEWSSWFGRHFRKGDWDVCSPEIARELSAIGYVFARRIHMASKVPIGVIDASRGGTTVETWTPIDVLQDIESTRVKTLLTDWNQKVADWDPKADLERRVSQYQQRIARIKKEGKEIPANEKKPDDLRPGPSMDQNRPGNCFASMIHPIKGLSIKGAIFHQGYNNCFNGTEGTLMYRDIFPEMIRAWRKAFDDPQMPFGILSLCTEGPVQTLDNYSQLMSNPGPYIREAQYQTFLDLYESGDKNVGFVSTYDLRRRWYHPQLKIPAGERIARWALATEYGFNRQLKWKPPIVSSMQVLEGSIVIRLDEPVDAVDDGGPIYGFAVAGEDRRFHPAFAEHLIVGKDDRGNPKKDKTALELKSPLVPNPVHYRFAWGRSPLANLQASRNSDVPFATQRSDDWPLENIPKGVLREESLTNLTRKQKNKIQEALREIDNERRIFNAQSLLKSENKK